MPIIWKCRTGNLYIPEQPLIFTLSLTRNASVSPSEITDPRMVKQNETDFSYCKSQYCCLSLIIQDLHFHVSKTMTRSKLINRELYKEFHQLSVTIFVDRNSCYTLPNMQHIPLMSCARVGTVLRQTILLITEQVPSVVVGLERHLGEGEEPLMCLMFNSCSKLEMQRAISALLRSQESNCTRSFCSALKYS